MVIIDGAWIRSVRNRLDLTQEEFALRMGVSQATVTHWETDRRKPLGPARILLEMLSNEAERTCGEKIPA